MTTQTETGGADRVSPVSQGTYALFEPPDGSVLLVYRPQGADQDERIHIPKPMVVMAKKMAEGQGAIPGPIGKMMERRLGKAKEKQSS